ncbi:hypothetical protein EW145_g5524 [Phellinidium pouzarii]|uniref:NADP-dependent oxidoreductase domain-containing protein n=1 Tax=Phellinidium pouzarii TaxID=167371 RepID=A0A4S4KZU9_9AGAM|nr:hypothetical protein EW145_g5524 [Phellinidium pouzarii]
MSQKFTLQSKMTLRDGNTIPLLGFGTYEIEGREAYNTVTWALEVYILSPERGNDSAAWYANENEVGNAILDFCKKKQVSRPEIFYTTKLRSNNGLEASKKAIQKSIEVCGLGYIDLYLIHGPLGGHQARMESWKAILEVKANGSLRSVGVSNYGVKHLQEMLDADVALPAVNQIDLHPFMNRTALVDFCHHNNIALEAWGPLARAYKLKHPVLGFIPLPKSSSKERIISNADIYDFELTDDEMKSLDDLDEYLVTDWDPSDCP